MYIVVMGKKLEYMHGLRKLSLIEEVV